MTTHLRRSFFFSLSMMLAVACQKNENLIVKEETNDIEAVLELEKYLTPEYDQFDFSRVLPEYLRSVGLQVKAVDNRKATLGRMLFYDKNLSRDGSVSCASCHQQDRAFSDEVAFSKGIAGEHSLRNSMALANVASLSAHYSPLNGVVPPFLWDNRATSIADLSRMAFMNEHEMGMTMPQVVEQVKKQPYYPYLWKQYFGDFEVTEQQVLDCISEFVGAIGSHNSKLDRALITAKGGLNIPSNIITNQDTNFIAARTIVQSLYYGNGETIIIPADTIITITIKVKGLPGFSTAENLGRDIFIANCTKCHSPIRPFQAVFAACNGLEMNYKDAGMAATTGRPEDRGVFKSPSLRNIALTAPYMHDGRFKTLEQVVEFYSSGVQPHPNLHPLLRHSNGDINLHLSEEQKNNLVAFLRTLTDLDVTRDERFSNPFK